MSQPPVIDGGQVDRCDKMFARSVSDRCYKYWHLSANISMLY